MVVDHISIDQHGWFYEREYLPILIDILPTRDNVSRGRQISEFRVSILGF